MKFKISSLVLFVGILFSGISYAEKYGSVADGTITPSETNIDLLDQQKKCFEPLIEELEKLNPDFERIKTRYTNTLTCIDPCITVLDANFLADECYDWESLYKILKGKSDFNDFLNSIASAKLIKCSPQKLVDAKKRFALDGIYYDPASNSCYDPKGNRYVNDFLNKLGVTLGALSLTARGQHSMGIQAELMGFGNKRTNQFLFTWYYQIDPAFISHKGKEGGENGTFALQADLEAAIYKTFMKDRCTPMAGLASKSQGKVFVDKTGEVPVMFKQASQALKASFGMVCSNFDSGIIKIEMQNDIVSVSALLDPVAEKIDNKGNAKRVTGYSFLGQQINLKILAQISHYFIQLDGGVTNHHLPNDLNLLEYSFATQIGVRLNNGVFFGGGADTGSFVSKVNDFNSDFLRLYVFGGGLW